MISQEEIEEKQKRFAVLVIDKVTGKKTIYTSIKKFTDTHAGFNRGTIYSYTSRKKVPYEDDRIILERIKFED